MAYENSAGIGVTNHYGARTTGGSVGLEHGENSTHTLSFNLTGEMINSAYVAPTYFPKGGHVKKAWLRVDEAFVVSTSGTVSLGGTAPGTDGIILTEAILEVVGTSDVTALTVGTWAEDHATGPLTTQKITKSISGTVGATSGKGTLVIEYINKTKV